MFRLKHKAKQKKHLRFTKGGLCVHISPGNVYTGNHSTRALFIGTIFLCLNHHEWYNLASVRQEPSLIRCFLRCFSSTLGLLWLRLVSEKYENPGAADSLQTRNTQDTEYENTYCYFVLYNFSYFFPF